MTVLVLGDAHAEEPSKRRALRSAYEAADETADADVALQAGDLGHYDPPIPTWFVAGNNEDFDVIDALRRRERSADDEWDFPAPGERDYPAAGDDLHLLASTAEEVAGLRVAGLSGNFAPTQYEKSRAALEGDRRRHFVREDVEAAMALDDVDVFLAHEAPRGLLNFGYDPGCEHVDAILDALDPELCLVGHFHRHAGTTRGGTRIVSLAPAWERYYTLDPETLALEPHATPEREA